VALMVGSGEVCFWRESGPWKSVLFGSVWQDCDFSRRENVFTSDFV
jgi:hypothetical protein